MKPNSTEIQPLELFSFQDLQEALREKIGENWKELGWKYAGDGSSRVTWGKYQFELFYAEGLDRLGKDKLRNLAIGTWHIDWDKVNGEWGFNIGDQEIAFDQEVISLGAYFWDGNKVIDCSYDMIYGIIRTFNLALKQVKNVEWNGSVELEEVLKEFSFEKVGEEWGWRVGEKWLQPEEMQSLVKVCAAEDLRDKSVEDIVSFIVEAAGRVDFSAWNYLKLVQLEKLMDQKLGEDWSGWKLYSDKAGNHWAAFDENFKLSYQELSEMVIGNMSIRWNLELGKWTTYFGETALEPKSGYWLHQLGKLWSLEEFHLDSGILLATWNKAKFLEGNLNWAEFLRNFTWEVEHPHLGFWRIGDYRLTFGELETLKARIMDQLGILSRAELMEEMERGAAEIWKGHSFGEILDRLRWPLMSWMVNGDRLQGPEGAWLTLAEARELHLGNAEEKIEKAILRARKSQKMAQTMDLIKQKLGKRFNREAWMVSEDGEQIKFTPGEGMKFSVPEFEALGKQMLYKKIIQTQQIEMVEVLREKIGENWGECGWTVNLNEEGEAWANFEGEKLRGGFSLAGLKMLLGRENSLRWSESNRGWQSWNDQILIGGSGTSEKSRSSEWNVWNRELRLTEPGELGRRFAAGRTMARRIVEEPWVSIWQHFDLDEEPDGVADQSGCLNWGWIIEGNWLSWAEVQLIMAGAEWQALFLKQGINGVVNGLKDHYRKLIEARFAPWHELNRILDEFFPNWEELGWSRKMSEDPPGAWMEDPYGLRVTMEEMAAMGIGASKIVDESNQKELNMNLESSMEFPEVEPRVVMERALGERIPNWKELGWTIKELEGKTLACPPEGSANPDTTLSYYDVQALFTGNLQWRWNEGGAWETWVGAHSLNGLEKFYWARKSGMVGLRGVDVFEGGMEVLGEIEEMEGMKVWAPLMRHFALEEEMGRGWGWRIGDVWIEAGKIKHFVADHLDCVNWNMESLVGALKNWANQVSGKNKVLHELKKKIGENWAELGWSLQQNLGTGQWMAHFGELVLGKLELDRMVGKAFGHFHPTMGGWKLYLNDSPRGDAKEMEDLESRYYWIGGKLVWVGAGEEIRSGEGCPLEFPEDGKWSELLAGYSVELRWDAKWGKLVWEWQIGDLWVTLDEMEEIRDCFLTEEMLENWTLEAQRERLEQLALACLEERMEEVRKMMEKKLEPSLKIEPLEYLWNGDPVSEENYRKLEQLQWDLTALNLGPDWRVGIMPSQSPGVMTPTGLFLGAETMKHLNQHPLVWQLNEDFWPYPILEEGTNRWVWNSQNQSLSSYQWLDNDDSSKTFQWRHYLKEHSMVRNINQKELSQLQAVFQKYGLKRGQSIAPGVLEGTWQIGEVMIDLGNIVVGNLIDGSYFNPGGELLHGKAYDGLEGELVEGWFWHGKMMSEDQYRDCQELEAIAKKLGGFLDSGWKVGQASLIHSDGGVIELKEARKLKVWDGRLISIKCSLDYHWYWEMNHDYDWYWDGKRIHRRQRINEDSPIATVREFVWNPAEKNPEYVMHTHTCDLTGIGEFFSLNETNWNLRQVGEKMEWFLAPEAGDEIALSEIIEKWVGIREIDGKKIWCLWKDRECGKGFTGVARTSELELEPGAVGKYFWNGRLVEEEDYEKGLEIDRVLSEMGLLSWRVEINPDTLEPEAAFGLDVSFNLEDLRKLNVVPGWVGSWKDGKLDLDGLERDEDGDVLIWDSVAEHYLFLEDGSSELVWNHGRDVKYGRETWQDSGLNFLNFPGRCEEFGTEARLVWQDGKFGWMIANEEFWTIDRIKNGEWDLEAARKRMAQRQEKDTLEAPALPIHGNLDYSGMARKATTPYTGYEELIQKLLDGGWNHVPAGGGLEERWVLGPAVIELSQLPLVVLGSMKLMLVDDVFEWSVLDGGKWRIIKDDEMVWDQNEKIFGKRVPDDLIVQFASHASVESMDFLKNPNVMNLLPADFEVRLVRDGWIWSSDTWGESGTMNDWAARMVKMQQDHYLKYMERRGLSSFELNLENPAAPKFKCGIAELNLDDYTKFTTVGEVKYVWNYETKIIDFLVKLTGWDKFKPWKESVSFNANGESWIFDEKAKKLRKLNGFGDGIFETNANEVQNEPNWPLTTHLQILQDRGALIGALDLDSEVPAVKVNGVWHNRAELEKLVKEKLVKDALNLETSKIKLNDLASKLGKDWSINLEDNLLVYRKENFSACFSVEQAEKFLNYELVGRMKGNEPIVWTWAHRTNPTDIGELASGREYRWDPVEEKLVVGEYSPLGVLLDRSEQIIPKAVEWDNYWKNVIQIDLKRSFPELTWALRGTPDCNEVAWEKIPELKIPRNRINISKSDHVRLINGIKVEFKDDFSTWRPCKYKYLYSIDQANQTITKLEMNVEGMLHCLAGPAMQTYHVDGKSREDRYFINGKELNMEDYQIEKDQIELQEIAQKLSGTVIGIGKDSRILLGGSRLSLEEARKVNRCDLVATLDSNRKWIWKEEKIVDRTNYPPANDSGQGSSENLADGRYINYNVNSKEYLIRTRKNGIATASSDFSANWWWSQPKAQELLNRLGSLTLQLHSGKGGDDYLSTVRLTINGIDFDFHTAENIFSSPLKQEVRFGWGWFVDGDVLGYGHMEEHEVDGLTNIYFTNEDGKHERKDVWYWRGERVPSQEDYHARKKTQATIDRLHEIAKILGPDRWTVDEVGMQLQSTDYSQVNFSLEEAEKINSTIPLGEIKNGEIIWKFGKISSFPKLFESEMDEVKKEALANGKWWYCAYNAKPWYYFRNHGAFSDETSNTWKFWSKEWGKSFLGAWGHLPWRIEMNEGRCLDSDKYSERVDLRLYGRVFTVDEARYIVDWDNPETLKNIDASQMHWGLRGDTWVGQRLSAQGPWRYVEEVSVDGSKKEYWLNPHTQERLADSEYQQMVLKEKLSQDLKELAAKMESAGLTNLQDKLNTLTRELVVESKASDPTTKELQQEFDRLSQTIDSKHLILTSDSIKIKGFAYSLAEAKRINSVDMVGELNAEGELIWTAISKADGSKQLANERYRWIRKDGNTNQYATRDQGKTSRVPGEKSYVVGLASPARKGYQVLEKLKSSKIPFKFLVHQYDSEDRYDVEIYGQKLSLDEALGIKSSYLQKELNTEARNLIYEDECLKEFHVNKNHQYHRADGPAITCYGPNGEIKEYHWYNDKYYSDYQAWQREVARGKVVEMKLKAEKELERLGTGFYLVEDFVEEVDGKLRLEYLILHQYNGVKTFTLDEVENVNAYDLIGVIDAESKELVWKIRHRITKETSLADGIYWDAGPNYRSYSARENGQIVEYGDKKSRDLVVDFWKNGVGRDLIQKFKECSANLEIKCVPRYGITKTSDIELAYSWTFFGNYFTLSEVEKILLAGDWTAKYINGGEAYFHKKSNTALTGQHWFLSGSGSMLQHVSFDQNGIIHSEDGPAVINYSNSESFPTKLYYWNGKCISEKAWNEEKLEKAKLALEKIKQACKVEIARLNEFGFELKEVRAAEQVVDYQICHAHTGRLFSLEEAARINLYDQYAELKDGKFQWFTKNRLTGEAAIPIVDLEYLYCNSTKYQGIRFPAKDTSGFWFDGVGKQLLEKFEKLNVACRIITKDYLECDLNQRFRLEIAGVEFSIAEALKIQDQLNGVIHGRNVFFNYDKQLVIKERDENLALHSENGPACRVQDAKNSKTMTDTYYWHGELLHRDEWLKRKEAIALKTEVPWTPEWRAKLLNETSQVEVYFTSPAGCWITTNLPKSDGYPNGALVQIVKDGQRETFIHHQNKWLRHEAFDKNDKGGTRVEYGEAIQNIADSNKNQNFFFGHKISRPKFDLNDDKRNGEFYGIDSNNNARRMFYTSWKDGRRHRVDGPALERFDEELRTVSAEYYLDGVEIPNSDWLTGRVIEKFDIYQGEWDKKTPEELTGNFWVWGHDYGPLHLGKVYPKEDFLTRFEIIDVKNKEYRYQVYQNGKPGDYTWVVNGTCFDSEDKYLASKKEEEKSKELTVQGRKLTPEQYASIKHLIDKKKDFTLLENGNGIAICGENLSWDQASQVKFGVLCYRSQDKRETLVTANEEHVNGLPDGTHWYLASCLVKVIIQNGAMHNEAGPALRIYGENISDRYYVDGKQSTQKNIDKDVKSFKDSQIKNKFLEFLKGFSNYHQDGGNHCLGQLCLTDLETYEVAGKNDNVSGTKTVLSQDGREWFVCKYVEGKKTEQFYIRNDGLIIHSRWNNKDLHSSEEASISEQLPEKHEWKPSHYHLNGNPYTKARWEWLRHVNNRDLFGAQINGLILTGNQINCLDHNDPSCTFDPETQTLRIVENGSILIVKENGEQSRMDLSQILPATLVEEVAQELSVWEEAGYRVAAQQIGSKLCDFIQRQAPKTKKFLASPWGRALVYQALGWLLLAHPTWKHNPKILKLSAELRIEGLALAGEDLFTTLLEFFLDAQEEMREVKEIQYQAKNAPIEYEGNIGTPEMEEEVELLAEQVIS